jgi:transcriptional regulator
MYQQPAFRDDNPDAQHDIIRRHPLGLLITAGPGGLAAFHMPFTLYAGERSGFGTLRAHVARGNPVLKELAAVAECLVVFEGPQHYVTPSWYATKRETGRVVPTWNYVTVQAWGKPTVMDDAAWLTRQLGDLTDQMEKGRAEPWAIADMPPDYTVSQLKGIVGIEILVTRSAGKWKVSQNKPEMDRVGVHSGMLAEGDRDAEAMAGLVWERSLKHREGQ